MGFEMPEQYEYKGCRITIQRGRRGEYEAGIFQPELGILFDARAKGKKACRAAANAMAERIEENLPEMKAEQEKRRAERLANLKAETPEGEGQRLTNKYGLPADRDAQERLYRLWQCSRNRLGEHTGLDSVPIGAVRRVVELVIERTYDPEQYWVWVEKDLREACIRVLQEVVTAAYPEKTA